MADAAASLDDILAAASPTERIVRVCVAGGLVAEHQALEDELETARRGDAGRLGGDSRARELAERIEAVQERMRAATFTFRFRALPPKQWSDLLIAHPDPQKTRAFDVDTFPDVAISACCVEPVGMDDSARAATLLERLSSAQRGELFDAAWAVNNSSPKEMISYAASAVLRGSATSSGTASPSGSPDPSSSAGS